MGVVFYTAATTSRKNLNFQVVKLLRERSNINDRNSVLARL